MEKSHVNVINEYIDVNFSIVQIQQFGISSTLVPPQKDLTNFNAAKRPDADKPDHVIIMVPGNPGIVGYYHDFNVQLYQKLNHSRPKTKNIPVLAISHNNFDYPAWNHNGAGSNSLHILGDCLSDKDKPHRASAIVNEPCHMRLQIRNKIVILKSIFDLSKTKFTFVGHSIGCYVIVEMLQDVDLNARTAQALFIHPALENLALTEKGAFWATMFKYRCDWFIAAFCLFIDTVLPDSVRPRLASWIKKGGEFDKISSEVRNALVQLSTYRILMSTVNMAKSEFSNVKDLHLSLIEPLVERLRIYYAREDHWVNSSHRQTLKDQFPNLPIKVKDAMHAFILKSEEVTYYASELVPAILEKLNDKE